MLQVPRTLACIAVAVAIVEGVDAACDISCGPFQKPNFWCENNQCQRTGSFACKCEANVGAIVGLVIAILFFIGIVTGLVCFRIIRRQQQQQQQQESAQGVMAHEYDQSPAIGTVRPMDPQHFPQQQHFYPTPNYGPPPPQQPQQQVYGGFASPGYMPSAAPPPQQTMMYGQPQRNTSLY